MNSLIKRLKSIILNVLHGKSQLYYINGNDALPPPLDPDVEEKMIDTITTEESRVALIEHNLRLMKAVSTFNKDKNIKLATYASRCIENEILMFIRKTSSQKREISIDEPLSVDWDGNELLLSDILGSDNDVVSREMEDLEERKILRSAVEELNPRERVIIEMRYGLIDGNELTQKEVADALGISQSYISRLEKKIMLRLRKRIEDKI